MLHLAASVLDIQHRLHPNEEDENSILTETGQVDKRISIEQPNTTVQTQAGELVEGDVESKVECPPEEKAPNEEPPRPSSGKTAMQCETMDASSVAGALIVDVRPKEENEEGGPHQEEPLRSLSPQSQASTVASSSSGSPTEAREEMVFEEDEKCVQGGSYLKASTHHDSIMTDSGISEHDATESDSSSESLGQEEEATAEPQEPPLTAEACPTQTEAPTEGEGMTATSEETQDIDRLDRSWFDPSSNDFFITSDLTDNSNFVAEFEPHKEIFDELSSPRDEASKIRIKQRATVRNHKARRAAKGDMTYDPAASDAYALCRVDDCKKTKVKARRSEDFDDLLLASDGEMIGREAFYMEVLSPLAEIENDMSIFDYEFEMRDDSWGTETNEPYFDVRTGQRILSTIYEFEVSSDEDDDDDDVPFALSNFRVEDHLQNIETNKTSETENGEVLRVNSDAATNGRDENIRDIKAIEISDGVPLPVHENKEVDKTLISDLTENKKCGIAKNNINASHDDQNHNGEINGQVSCAGKHEARLATERLCNLPSEDHEAGKDVRDTPLRETLGESEADSSARTDLRDISEQARTNEMADVEANDVGSLASPQNHSNPEKSSHAEDTDLRDANIVSNPNMDEFVSGSKECIRKLSSFGPNPLLVLSTPSDGEAEDSINCFGPHPVLVLSPGSDGASGSAVMTQESHEQPAGEYSSGKDVNSSMESPRGDAGAGHLPPLGGEGHPDGEISRGGDIANAPGVRGLEESLVCEERPEKGAGEARAPDSTPVQEGYADHSPRMNECADTTQATQNSRVLKNRPNDAAGCKESEDIIAAWDSHILQHLEKDSHRDVDFDIFKVESDVFETSENITTDLEKQNSFDESVSQVESKGRPGGVQNKCENNNNSTTREGEYIGGIEFVDEGDKSGFSLVSETMDERKSVPVLEGVKDAIDEPKKRSNNKDEVDTLSGERLMAEKNTSGITGENNRTKEEAEERNPEKEKDKEEEVDNQEEEMKEEKDEGIQNEGKQSRQEVVKGKEIQETMENKTMQEKEEKNGDEVDEKQIKEGDKEQRKDNAEDKQENQEEEIKQNEHENQNITDKDRRNDDNKNTEEEDKQNEHEEGKQEQEKRERREEALEHVPQGSKGDKEATEQDVKKVENDASIGPPTSKGSEESSPEEMNQQPPSDEEAEVENRLDRSVSDAEEGAAEEVDSPGKGCNFRVLLGNLAKADFEALLREKYSDYDPNKPPPKPKRLFLRRLSSDPNMKDKMTQQVENDKILASLQNGQAPKPPVRVKRRKQSPMQASPPLPSQDRPVPPEALGANENDASETRENGDCGSSSSSVVGYEEERGGGGGATPTPSTLVDTSLGILSVAEPEPREGSNGRPEANAKCSSNERVPASCEAGTRTMHGEYLEGGKHKEEGEEGEQERENEGKEKREKKEKKIDESQRTKGKEDEELEKVMKCEDEPLEADLSNAVEKLMDIISSLDDVRKPSPCVINEDNRDKTSSVSSELTQNSPDTPDFACATSAMNLRNSEAPEMCVQASSKEGEIEKHPAVMEDEITKHGNEKNTEGKAGIGNEGDKEGSVRDERNEKKEKEEEERQGASHEAIKCDTTLHKPINEGRDEVSLEAPRPPVRKKRSPSMRSTREGAPATPPAPRDNQEATPPPVPLRTYRGYSSLPRPAKSQSRSSPTPHDARAPPRTKRVARSASTATCSNRPQVTPKPTASASGSPQLRPASADRDVSDGDSVKRVHITSLVTPRLRRIKTFLVTPVSPKNGPRKTFQINPCLSQSTPSIQVSSDAQRSAAQEAPVKPQDTIQDTADKHQDASQVIPTKTSEVTPEDTPEVTPEVTPKVTSENNLRDANYGTPEETRRPLRVRLPEEPLPRRGPGSGIQRKNTPHIRKRYHTIADGTAGQKRTRENSVKRHGSLRAIKYLTLPNTVLKKLKNNSKKEEVPPISCLPRIFGRKQRSYDMTGSVFSRAEIPELTPENDPHAAKGAKNASRSPEGSEEGFSTIFNFFTALEFADDKESRPPIFTDVELRYIMKDGQKRSSYPSCDTPEVPKRKRKKGLDSPIFDMKALSNEGKPEEIAASPQTEGPETTTRDDDKASDDGIRNEHPINDEETTCTQDEAIDLSLDELSKDPFDDSGIGLGLGETEEEDTPKGIPIPPAREPPAVQIQTWAERQGQRGLELPRLYLRVLPEEKGAKPDLSVDMEEESESEEEGKHRGIYLV